MEVREDADEEIVYLDNLLEKVEEEMEAMEDAHALLGPADDKHCTYIQGYMDRQVLYVCKTCCSDDKKSGICLACSLQCHDGHDMIELYTKRNFKCDCGNSKYPDNFKCQLEPKKCGVNDLNEYNNNFNGLYCICSRPYPDLEDTTDDLMIQCIICEDWLHGRHASSLDLKTIEFEEMICNNCLTKHNFLLSYIHLCSAICDVNKEQISAKDSSIKPNNYLVTIESKNKAESELKRKMIFADPHISKITKLSNHLVLNVCDNMSKSNSLDNNAHLQLNITDKYILNGISSNQKNDNNSPNIDDGHQCTMNLSTNVQTNKSSSSQIGTSLLMDPNMDNIQLVSSTNCDKVCGSNKDEFGCLLERLKKENNYVVDLVDGAVFWPSGWREKLCSCVKCLALYEAENISFLPKFCDTLNHYESKCKSIESIASQHITQMNHVQKIQLVEGYMALKNGLTDFLKQFENGKVIKEEDIKNFFERLHSNKNRNEFNY